MSALFGSTAARSASISLRLPWSVPGREMRLRARHPGLRSPNVYPAGWDGDRTRLDDAGFGFDRERNLVVYHRWGEDGAGRLERFYIVLNFSPSTQHVGFEVPDGGPWVDLLGGAPGRVWDGRLRVDVGGNWGAIFHRTD